MKGIYKVITTLIIPDKGEHHFNVEYDADSKEEAIGKFYYNHINNKIPEFTIKGEITSHYSRSSATSEKEKCKRCGGSGSVFDPDNNYDYSSMPCPGCRGW